MKTIYNLFLFLILTLSSCYPTAEEWTIETLLERESWVVDRISFRDKDVFNSTTRIIQDDLGIGENKIRFFRNGVINLPAPKGFLVHKATWDSFNRNDSLLINIQGSNDKIFDGEYSVKIRTMDGLYHLSLSSNDYSFFAKAAAPY